MVASVLLSLIVLAVSSLNVIISERVCIKLQNHPEQCFFVSSQEFRDSMSGAFSACQNVNMSDQEYRWRLPIFSTNKKVEFFNEAMKNVNSITVQNAVFWIGLKRQEEKCREAVKNKTIWADSTKWWWFDDPPLNMSLANGTLDSPKWKQHWNNSVDDEPNNFMYRYEDSFLPERCVMGEWNRGFDVVWLDVPCDGINEFLRHHSNMFSKGFVKLHICESVERIATPPTTTQTTRIHSTMTHTMATNQAEMKTGNGKSEEPDTNGEVWPYVMIGVTVLLILICLALVVVIVRVRRQRKLPARPSMVNGSSTAPEDSLSPFFQPTRKKKKRKMGQETDEKSRPDSGSGSSIIKKKNRDGSLDLIFEVKPEKEKSGANVEKKERI